MAVAYQSDGGTVWCNANNNNAISVPLPATRPVGSVLLFVAWCRLISAAAPAPSGYTLLSTHTSGTASGGRLWVYAKEVVGGESAPSVTPAGTTGTSGDIWGACLYCYSGVDLSGGIGSILDGTPTTQDASGTTTCTYPALTIAAATSYVVRTLARFRDAVDTFTFTATWNEREDAGTTTRLGGQHHLQDKQATASGSQATVTVAPSNTTAARYLAVTLALKAGPLTVAVDDTVDLADDCSPDNVPAAGTDHTVTPSDSVALADARAIGRDKALADSLALADARTMQRGKAVVDTVALADLLASAKTIPKALADTLTLTDLLSAAKGKGVSISDSVVLADSFGRVMAYGRTQADGLTLTDSTIDAQGIRLGDALALADLLSRATTTARQIADSVALADARSFAQGQAVADIVALADQLARTMTKARSLADTVTLADQLTRAVGKSRTLADTVLLTDARALAQGQAQADVVALADQLARVAGYARTVSDTVTLADAVTPTKSGAGAQAVNDLLALADQLSRVVGFSRTVADTISVADSFSRLVAKAVLVHDVVAVSDGFSRIAAYVRLVSESVALGDALQVSSSGLVFWADSIVLGPADSTRIEQSSLEGLPVIEAGETGVTVRGSTAGTTISAD